MKYARELDTALAAVRTAARLCEQVRADQQSTAMRKPDASPVTLADYGAQAIICQTLAIAFPDNPIVGEEDARLISGPEQGSTRRDILSYVQRQHPEATEADLLAWIGRGKGEAGDRFWTLDPIDGTKGYVRGDHYAVALALIEDGVVQLGCCACPALPAADGSIGTLFWGIRGEGAWQQPLQGGPDQRLSVSDHHGPTAVMIESVELDHGDPQRQQAIARALDLNPAIARMDSLAKYGVIARGEADLYLRLTPDPDRRENIWDHAVGVLLLEEAGGTVTDDRGQALDFSRGSRLWANHGIVASNGRFHADLLAHLTD